MIDQFASLIMSSPFQNSLFVVGGVILLGFILSRLKINSFRIGVTGVLIVGVVAGLVLDKYNVEMDHGALISFIPLVVVGLFARKSMKMNFYTLAGLLCGASTDTPALVYAERMNNDTPNSLPSAAYAAVYPFTLVLRIITAQLFVVI